MIKTGQQRRFASESAGEEEKVNSVDVSPQSFLHPACPPNPGSVSASCTQTNISLINLDTRANFDTA